MFLDNYALVSRGRTSLFLFQKNWHSFMMQQVYSQFAIFVKYQCTPTLDCTTLMFQNILVPIVSSLGLYLKQQDIYATILISKGWGVGLYTEITHGGRYRGGRYLLEWDEKVPFMIHGAPSSDSDVSDLTGDVGTDTTCFRCTSAGP